MKKYLTIKNLIIATITMTIIAILVFVLSRGNNPLPVLTSAIPAPNSSQNNVVDAPLLTFSSPVIATNFTITSSPSENWTIAQKDAHTLSLNHAQYLQSATKYTIMLSYNGKPLPDYVFTTAGGQGDPRFYQQLQNELKTKYPLAKMTPYETADFRVVYSGPLTLEITLKNQNIDSIQAISAVKTWVTNQGGDPTTHQYVIATPSPAPTK